MGCGVSQPVIIDAATTTKKQRPDIPSCTLPRLESPRSKSAAPGEVPKVKVSILPAATEEESHRESSSKRGAALVEILTEERIDDSFVSSAALPYARSLTVAYASQNSRAAIPGTAPP